MKPQKDKKMKTDFQTIKKTNVSEVLLTVIVLALVGTMLMAGADLTGIVSLPAKMLAYLGGILLAFVVLFGFLIVHNCVKFMLKKEGSNGRDS